MKKQYNNNQAMTCNILISCPLIYHHTMLVGGCFYYIILIILLLLCCYQLTYNLVDFMTEPTFCCNITACKLSLNQMSTCRIINSQTIPPSSPLIIGYGQQVANNKCRCCQNSTRAGRNYYITCNALLQVFLELTVIYQLPIMGTLIAWFLILGTHIFIVYFLGAPWTLHWSEPALSLQMLLQLTLQQ